MNEEANDGTFENEPEVNASLPEKPKVAADGSFTVPLIDKDGQTRLEARACFDFETFIPGTHPPHTGYYPGYLTVPGRPDLQREIRGQNYIGKKTGKPRFRWFIMGDS